MFTAMYKTMATSSSESGIMPTTEVWFMRFHARIILYLDWTVPVVFISELVTNSLIVAPNYIH